MKLRNNRDALARNVRFWRVNLERGLGLAAPHEAERIRRMIADFALVEIALKKPFQNEFELEYAFPEVGRVPPIIRARGPIGH